MHPDGMRLEFEVGERVHKRWVDPTVVWREGQRARNPPSGGYLILEFWRRP